MSIIRHKKELQNYSVYDSTSLRVRMQQPEVKLGKPGLLQEQIYTPPNEKQVKKHYIYGTNNILLNYNGTQIWRIPENDIDFQNSQTIKFNIIQDNNQKQFSQFYYTGLLELMLFSQRIFISKKQSSWYTWNIDYTECVINHKLDGYIDFIARYCEKEQVYLHNKVIDNNNLLINVGDFFNKDLIQVLKAFTITSDASLTLNKLINFDLYKLSKNSIINVYKLTDNNTEKQYQELEDNLELVVSIPFNNINKTIVDFIANETYRIYAITEQNNREDYFEVIIWKLDKPKDVTKQNVFSFKKYNASECQWLTFNNDQQYDLQIPYRFIFLGYVKQHDLKMPLTDATGEQFLNNQQSFADTKTLTNEYCITKQFLYTIEEKKLKVLTPNLYTVDEANFIIVYSNCWAQTYYCNMSNSSITYQTWTTEKNIYNEEVNILTLKHTLNGIVKINVRDVREDMYETYILDENTIQIIFLKHYKQNKTIFYVDLYTIWKKDI